MVGGRIVYAAGPYAALEENGEGRGRQALRPPHHRRHEMPDARRADLLHGGVELDAHQFEHALDAGLAEGAEAPDIGPADADGAWRPCTAP